MNKDSGKRQILFIKYNLTEITIINNNIFTTNFKIICTKITFKHSIIYEQKNYTKKKYIFTYEK